ncbi:MAG: prolyl oligopeptidase family serine peptidase [bacterium]|nr:prolyl oligopeptidase family serine peptidase [bacterium]
MTKIPMVSMMLLLGCLCSLAGCSKRQDPEPGLGHAQTGKEEEGPPYLERRRHFETKLSFSGPAPQDWNEEVAPPSVLEVEYPSGDLFLKAWVTVPGGATGAQYPAIVYFHGAFAFGRGDFLVAQNFRRAGLVVMMPMLRGENGNPGSYELFLGEVDDGKAAVTWLADQPYVDHDRIFTFGHSVGGAISALLSLHDDVPIRHGGGNGGIYHPDIFREWSDIVPFNSDGADEVSLRLLLGNVRWMHHEHYAYIGTEDGFDGAEEALEDEPGGRGLLHLIPIEGDHFSSLQPSMEAYIRIIEGTDGLQPGLHVADKP